MKRIPAKSLVIVLLTAGLTILSGCFNLLDPPQEGESERGSLTIHIGGTPEVARTLYPNAIFTRYTLSFTPLAGQAAYGPLNITDGTSSVVIDDIAPGSWAITAKGYVKIGGNEYEAAASAQTVDISGGPQSVSFTLSARNESSGDSGVFSYAVSFPADKVDSASLRLLDPATQNGVHDSDGNWLYDRDLTTASAGQISLNPGYYLMRIELRNQYQGVARTEIVHIYSNMETTANYAFTEADFTDFITLSGTVNVTVNGAAPNYANLYLYDNPECSGQNIGYTWVDPYTGAWSMSFDSPASTTTYYIVVSAWDGVRDYRRQNAAGPITVDPASTPGPIDIGTIEFSSIILSGTVSVTINGVAPTDSVYLYLYDNSECTDQSIGDAWVDPDTGAWSMGIDPPASTATYYIAVQTWDDVRSYRRPNVAGPIIVDPTSPPGLINIGTVDFSSVTLSGTVNLTVNGNAPQWVSVSAYTVSKDWQMPVGNAQADPNTGAWTMSIDPFDTPTEVYFTAQARTTGGEYFYYEPDITRTVSGSDISGIDLGTKNFAAITLSGTVHITVNGTAPEYVSVYAYTVSNNRYVRAVQADPSTGAWTMSIDPFDTPTELYFTAEVQTKGVGSFSYEPDPRITKTVSNGDISGIDLGTKNFEIITLSGTIDLQLNGNPLEDYKNVDIGVMNSATGGKYLAGGYIEEPGNWTITMEPFSGPVSFVVEIDILTDSGDVYILKEIGPVTLNGTTQSIDLGQVNVQTSNLTVSFTQGGTPVQAVFAIMKEAFTLEDLSGDSFYVKGIAQANGLNTSWTIPIPSSSPTSVWFLVMTKDGLYKTANAVDISSGPVSLEINNLELLAEIAQPVPAGPGPADPEPMMTQSRNLLRSRD